ncbi:hypothetical protein QCA50_017429 [Cerrena zonata]|uniref:SMP-30/Gluconolactonase/LRE-like region domain-containing protein n=1 Tax=Cerrena zonata TaxID=2478898 RepID=A0AAW0FF50_9APHY
MTKVYELDESNIFFKKYRGELTEGITYNPSNDTLLWVDIIRGEVHRVKLSREEEEEIEKSHEVLKFEDGQESIGAIGLTNDDNIVIICAKYGICKGNFKKGEIEYIVEYNHTQEQKKRLRSNDGIIDPWGHLWIGVMTDFPVAEQEGVKPEGRLYRINCHDLTIETMVQDCFISNGLNFSFNGKKFYWTDSLTYKIWSFDYDYISNTLSNKQEFINMKTIETGESPEPDGLTIDKNDEIYSAIFSAGKIVHLNQQAEITEIFKLPTPKITCVTIGGSKNNQLFITSAKDGSLGGYLYKIQLNKSLNGKIKFVWGGKS